jgi:hypothetical protein
LIAEKDIHSPETADKSSTPFAFFVHNVGASPSKRNFDEIDRWSSFGGKRSKGKRNFDEIDRYGIMYKKAFNEHNLNKRQFDEIDRWAVFKRPLWIQDNLGRDERRSYYKRSLNGGALENVDFEDYQK